MQFVVFAGVHKTEEEGAPTPHHHHANGLIPNNLFAYMTVSKVSERGN